MSDPVTNVAIEDVLSSIRRLVSEDARAVRPQAVPAGEAGSSDDMPSSAADPFAGKLVLTPALRVAEEAGEGFGDDGDGYEDGSVQEPQDDVTVAISEPEGGAEPLALGQGDLAEGADLAPEELVSDERAPELAPEWQADSAEDMPEALAWVDHAEDTQEAMPEDDAAAWADVEDDFDAQAGTFTRAEEAQPFVFASSRDGAESRRAGAESYRDEADLFGEEDTILDEEALREMVADIVRQELQGALGERITRNVRKLVRREIHRALTSHELD